MDAQYQDLATRTLVARDGPKFHIDPAFILFCRQSWHLSVVSLIFYYFAFRSWRARKLGQRHAPVIFQGWMVAANLTLLIFLCLQWYSYHRAFLALDKEFPNQIFMPVHIAAYLALVFASLLGCMVILTLLGLWRPKIIIHTSRLDEEARHGDDTGYDPALYNQPLMSWVNHIALNCAWIVTCVSMQAKLPGAAYANMDDAELFPASRLELNLTTLASAHFFFGIVGWLIFAIVIVQFGKSVVLFRVDVVARFKEAWRTMKANMEVRRANERALQASREATTWASSSTSSPSSGERSSAEPDIEMVSATWSNSTLAENREETRSLRDSWETVDSPEIPHRARLRN